MSENDKQVADAVSTMRSFQLKGRVRHLSLGMNDPAYILRFLKKYPSPKIDDDVLFDELELNPASDPNHASGHSDPVNDYMMPVQ